MRLQHSQHVDARLFGRFDPAEVAGAVYARASRRLRAAAARQGLALDGPVIVGELPTWAATEEDPDAAPAGYLFHFSAPVRHP